MATSRTKHSETVLLIMNNDHAARVRNAIQEHELRSKTSPSEARVNGAIITALQMIYNKPDGWYDAELRAKLARSIDPRLNRKEFVEAMTAVYAVVPLRQEDPKIQLLRVNRRQKLEKKS